MKKPSPLAIVGMACRFPKADGVTAYWSNIVNAADCITDVPADTHWNPEEYFDADPKAPDMTYAKRGGFLDPVDFDALSFGIPPTTLEATDTSQLLGLIAARECLKDAGYDARSFDRDRTSVILGVTGALPLLVDLGARLGHPRWRKALQEAGLDDALTDAIVQKISDQYAPWQEASFPGLLGNVVAGRVANALDLGGSNCVVDAACASSLSAVHLASMELWSGRADMVLTGGVDTFNDIFMYMCFSKTPALSPSGEARPFDHQGDGVLLGEGVGVMALKRLQDAERDGDKIYTVLKGLGSSSDGKGNAIYAPSATGQMKALRRAYEQADISPRTIELVEGHGTGTKVGDAVEINALSEVYGETAQDGERWCAVGSVKSQIGHTKAAAGAAGMIKAALALHKKVLPPSIKVRRPLDSLTGESPFYLSPAPRPWLPKDHPRRAAISAFGFGGSNFHMVLEEYERRKQGVDWDGDVQILAFAADTKDTLIAAIQKAPLDDWSALTRFAARSRHEFRPNAPQRLTLVAQRDGDIAKLRQRALTLLAGPDTTWTAPEGIFYATGSKSGKLGVLFPGQGSQYVGMLRDLAVRFPQIQDVLADVDKAFQAEFETDARLTDLIYPMPAYGQNEAAEQTETLRRTQHAQPAIGAVSIGLLKVLSDFGLIPEAAAGHSYGEITALCASERFDEQALYLLSLLRGKLMAEGDGDRGAMVAVRAPIEAVASLVEDHALDLVPANKNAPDQVVLSGLTREVDRAAEIMDREGLSYKKLPVAAAFHSTLVAPASKPFAAKLAQIDFSASRIPVYANTTGQPYPEAPEQARDLLANQLAKPVAFVDEIEQMYADGVRIFLEIGPGARLTGLVKSILNGREVQALSVDASSGKRSGMIDLARALAQLSAAGCSVDLAAWEPDVDQSEPGKPRMTIPITGANYLDPKTKARAAAPIAKRLEQPFAPSAAAQTDATRTSAPLERAPKQATIEARVSHVPPAAPARPMAHVQEEPTISNQVQNPAASVNQPAAAAVPVTGDHLAQALQIAQDSMVRLQHMQQQTAELHRQFLLGQESAQNNLAALMAQQQQLLSGTPITPMQTAPTTSPAATAQPIMQAQPVAPQTPAPVAPPAPVAAQPATPQPTVAQSTSITVQPTTPQPATPPQVAPAQDIAPILLHVVSEKTGYPTDMLDLDMSLDADLGIDSIKRVEIFSALQEQIPNAPEIKPDEMGDLQTLADVQARLQTAPMETATLKAPVVAKAPATSLVSEKLIAIVAEKTGYPVDMLDLDMSLDADLGIDSIKRVEILSAVQEAMPELPAIQPDELGALQTLREIVDRLGAAAPVTTETTSTQVAASGDQIAATLMQVIADKTGYPTDMLALDMSLEADLGIDSIKRVEIFSAVSEAMPDLPEIKPEEAGAMQTLAEIVAALGSAPTTTTSQETAAQNDGVADQLIAIVADKTGYPADMLALDMNLEADLGIDSIKRVEILSAVQEAMPNLPEIKPDEAGAMQTLAEIVTALGATATATSEASAPTTANPEQPKAEPAVAEQDEAPLNRAELQLTSFEPKAETLPEGDVLIVGEGPIASELAIRLNATVIDLNTTTLPKTIAALLIFGDAGAPKDALFLAQRAAKHLADGARFATITQIDGSFGLNAGADVDVHQGALAGLTKTAGHEWPTVICKAIDVAPDFTDVTKLAALIDDTTAGEFALNRDGVQKLDTIERPVGLKIRKPLGEGDLVLITGGARGVTAEVATALAAFKPRLILIGRTPLPEGDEPSWLNDLTEPAAVKAAIAKNAGKRLKPKDIEHKFRALMAAREVRNNLTRIQAAGAEVHYRAVDMRDASATREMVAEIRAAFGPIQGLVHGAGVLADRRIADKTREQVETVFQTKIGAANALLDALGQDPLKILVMFSSSTARYGRVGQVDYAMANETLNKMAQRERARRPDCRTLSINWGPWDGGMVDAGLKQLFAQEGIGLIGLRSGARYLIDELSAEGPVETVVIGQLETDKKTPVEPIKVPSEPSSKSSADTQLIKVFDRQLGLGEHPFLEDHVLDGKAVLPTVIIAEWLAHGALANNLGFKFHGFRNLSIFKGVRLEPGQRVTLSCYAATAMAEGERHVAMAELRSENGQNHLHARAEILMAMTQPQPQAPELEAVAGAYADNANNYQHLFHGPRFQGLEAVDTLDATGLTARVRTADLPRNWYARPLRNVWLADPLALDAAFQALVLWSITQDDAPNLPTGVDAYEQFAKFPAGEIEVRAHITRRSGAEGSADIEFRKGDQLLARMRGYRFVTDAKLKTAYARNQLETVETR